MAVASRVPQNRRQTLEGYRQMMEESHARLCAMEKHLEHLVNLNRQAFSREHEDEHRIVPAEIEAAGLATFIIPMGEAWICERIAGGCGQATVPVYVYRDIITDERLAETATTDANGRFSDGISNRLYMPERTQLLVSVATANIVHANMQVRVLKRYIRPISEEEAYVNAGGLEESEFDTEERIWEAVEPGEPEPERHETETEPAPRPQPHFGERIEEAVERVLDTATGIRPQPHFKSPAWEE